ncbi:MAG: outer membrane beta-barrel protein [Syntrophothermus sp.]
MKKIKLFSTLLLSCSLLFSGTIAFAQDESAEKKDDDTKKENVEFFRGGIKVQKLGQDTTVVFINNNPWHGMSNHHGPFCHHEGKYNGHWAGVELGWNGYLTPDFDMNFPAGEKYMDLNWSRSLVVNLNPVELNLNLVKNHLGLTSGIGFSLQNYYFKNSTFLTGDSSKLMGYTLTDNNMVQADMKVNKLFLAWLNVPVLLEYQTRSGVHMNSFHFGLGVIGGVKIGSYTKQWFYSRNVDYNIYDETKHATVATLHVGEKPIRQRDSYYLNPFKVDVTARIGWSFINLWGTYSLTRMFEKDKGPELYPYTVGITLLGW